MYLPACVGTQEEEANRKTMLLRTSRLRLEKLLQQNYRIYKPDFLEQLYISAAPTDREAGSDLNEGSRRNHLNALFKVHLVIWCPLPRKIPWVTHTHTHTLNYHL